MSVTYLSLSEDIRMIRCFYSEPETHKINVLFTARNIRQISQIDLPFGAFYEISKHSHFRNDSAQQKPSAIQIQIRIESYANGGLPCVLLCFEQ